MKLYQILGRPLLVVAMVLTLVFALDSSTSQTAVPDPVDGLPTPQEIDMLDDMSEWMFGPKALTTPKKSSKRRLSDKIVTSDGAKLRDVIRTEGRSFEMFRKFHDRDDRRDYLSDLPFGREIDRAAHRYGLDSLLLAALVEVESAFHPAVVSPVGAVGLTQVMPSTAAYLGHEGDLADPIVNVDIGARYLSRMLKMFEGDLSLALAAYNAGPGAVERFEGIPPYRETQRYVDRVLSIYVEHHRDLWRHTGASKLLAR